MDDFRETFSAKSLTDPQALKRFMFRNKKDLMYWGIFLGILILIYFLISDGDFSFCFTLSGAVQMFGFLVIAIKVKMSNSASGLSLNTFVCYIVVFFFRLCSILFFEGYLPYDPTGDFIYRINEVISFGLCIYVAYLMYGSLRNSYNKDLDAVQAYYIIIPAAILALLFHPSLNQFFPADVFPILNQFAWTFALYTEAVAMFPQIWVFTKRSGEIENYTSHYVACQAISRIFSFIFWTFSYHELNDPEAKSMAITPGHVGYCVYIAQILQIILMGDYLYHYFKAIRSGMPMSLPNYIV